MSLLRTILLATALLTTSAVQAADWTSWRGPWATGVSPETKLPAEWDPDPKVKQNLIWEAHYGSRSTPIVMKGRVFLFNYSAEKTAKGEDKADTIQERVLCLDEKTGKLIWEYKFNIFHTDIVTVRLGWTNMAADPKTGYIYVHGTAGTFVCLDGMASQPKVVWQRSLTEEYGRITGYGGRVTSPTIFEDLVFITMLNSSWGDQAKGAHRFFAFDNKTGEVRWISEPGTQPKDTLYSVPVVGRFNGQDILISGSADGSVYGVKARTGEPVWGYNFGVGAINCSPVIDGDLVYIGHGEESPNGAIQGRVICLNAAKIKNGEPELVWQVDGLKARYTSPVIHDKKLYITDEIGKLYCLDTANNGKQLWKHSYGRDSRGSPVVADGKIYIADVNGKFHILGIDPTGKKCKVLHSHAFFSPSGDDIEINGSPAIANGKIYFSTSEATYCIGTKDATPAPEPKLAAAPAKGGKITHLQVVPADIAVHPGDTVKFKVRGYDENGVFVDEVAGGDWSLPVPPLPPGAMKPPPPLDGVLKGNEVTVDAKKPRQHGYVLVKVNGLTGKARVRVAPRLPYVEDFSKVPDGVAPAGWVNTQGKFYVSTVKGEKVLRKVNDKPSPLIARGNAFITLPNTTDYTIECDVLGGKSGDSLPDVGIVANRYNLMLSGNIQKLRLNTWDALPRLDKTINFPWKEDVWYRMKLTVSIQDGKGVAKGKVWERTAAEPAAWTVEIKDNLPNTEGSAALYGYVAGIEDTRPGTEILYANVKITPNGKAGK